ncbi:LysR family transcriptional regulator [Caenimonas soli]|uniref:LysR family transcriptional regulator n=1 Tax=Caenimonas soli TaxID=2735555 RepID=UPI00155698F3|nr:LysR family transcriptional regulator [Caenimonas soli]NPC58466.1 LysR family transcriptional regulator [Caenimonas soli]
MNLKQLETVVQVARLGSLARAATAMGLAQSIVSRNVSQLELAWGDRLFTRTGRGMALSTFGEMVLPEIEALLEQAVRLDEAVRGKSGVPAGVVRVGVVPSLANSVVPALFADLRARAPGVKLAITEAMSGQLDELLASGRIELAVTNRYEKEVEGEDCVGQITTYLVLHPAHKFSRRKSIRLAEIAGMPLVVPSAPSGLRTVLDAASRKLKVTFVVHMEAESLSVMKEVAMSGEAMTILPLCAVQREVSAGKLAVVKITEPALPRKIMIASTRHHALSKAARFTMARLHATVPPLLRASDSSHP